MMWSKLSVLLLVSSALGLLEMIEPAPFRSFNNTHTKKYGDELLDHDLRRPITSFHNPVCRGRAADMKTGMGIGDPVASWPTNSDQVVIIENHPYLEEYEGLGSCQASISYDDGTT